MKIRAAMHVHSTWSYDGRWPLERLVPAFAKRGYRVLLMTEHDLGFDEERRLAYWEACRRASTEELLVVPGMEYSDPSNTIHLLVWGNIPFLGTGQATLDVLRKATEQGGVCVLAHPSRRSAATLFQTEWLQYLSGIEIWNRKTDGWAASPEATQLIARTGATAMVGLDFHSPKQFFPLAMCLETAGRPDANNVLNALRSRSCHGEVFGCNVSAFTGALVGTSTRSLEQCRRLAARSYRSVASWSPVRRISTHGKNSSTPPPAAMAE